jgi:hypothetical protein
MAIKDDIMRARGDSTQIIFQRVGFKNNLLNSSLASSKGDLK